MKCTLLYCNGSLIRVIADKTIIIIFFLSKCPGNDVGGTEGVLRLVVFINNDYKKCIYTSMSMKKKKIRKT